MREKFESKWLKRGSIAQAREGTYNSKSEHLLLKRKSTLIIVLLLLILYCLVSINSMAEAD